ncbi:uncharacterized protein LOC142228966 [Haematobia irritans]|uniref:uncharacterized protein LOC142228966 n=1 Tax=Haematobia irritans TaxID=7368 RepID=UPI003F4FCC21
MRIFLTLCSLLAFALAKPQYNYGGSSFGGGPSRGFGGSGSISFPSSSASSFNGGSSFGLLGGKTFESNPSINNGDSFQGFESTLVHKQFITVSGPEDNDNLERTKHLVIGRPQTNYRVVFIKAPSSSNANVQLTAEYAPNEEKTVIYVLSKKDNNLEISDIATPEPTVPSKPEVFFIKYKTEEEAQHAQHQIQAEYDRIEGSSEHTDAGIAPQQSVIGILGDSDNGSGSFGSHSHSGGNSHSFSHGGSNFKSSGSSKSSAYLPPTLF